MAVLKSVTYYKNGMTFNVDPSNTLNANTPLIDIDDNTRRIKQNLDSLVKVLSVVSLDYIQTDYTARRMMYKITNYDAFLAYGVIDPDGLTIEFDEDVMYVTFPAGVKKANPVISRSGVYSNYFMEYK